MQFFSLLNLILKRAIFIWSMRVMLHQARYLGPEWLGNKLINSDKEYVIAIRYISLYGYRILLSDSKFLEV